MNAFEIYYAYLRGCAEFNQQESPEAGWEWHHTLPQCLFGDQPIGLWLTKEQHAVASVLQSEAFQLCCVTGMMKKHLPEKWWPLFRKWKATHMVIASAALTLELREELGRKLSAHPNTVRARLRESYSQERLAQRREWGRTSHSPESRREAGRRGGKAGRGNPGKRVNNGATTNAQKWQCLVTGKVLPPGPLTLFQRHRNIDPSLRTRVQ